MGNILLEQRGHQRLKENFEKYLNSFSDQGEVQDKPFFENKVFRTISVKSQSMQIVIKVHSLLSQMNLATVRIHENNFLCLKEKLNLYANLMPFQQLINFTDSKSYKQDLRFEGVEENSKTEFLAVCRQQLHTTLEDRLIHAVRAGIPLTQVEKHYLALQMLLALHVVHQLKLFHGNVRNSNFLMTASDHIVLSDFASYKPFYIREDQLGEFRIIYETSIKHCTLAPEKFKVSTAELLPGELDINLNKQLLSEMQAMDMFSVGVCIAELYMDGQFLFTFENLMRYRKDEFQPNLNLNPQITEFVKNLITSNPKDRFNSGQALQYFAENILGERKQTYQWIYSLNCAFTCSHHFSQSDLRVSLVRKIFPQLIQEVCRDSKINLQFQYALPIPVQKVSVIQKFADVLKEQEPKLEQVIKGMNKINLDLSFQPQWKKEDSSLVQEPFENMENLRVRKFQTVYTEFRKNQEPQNYSQVEKLKHVFLNDLNKRQQVFHDVPLQCSQKLDQSQDLISQKIIEQQIQSDEARLLIKLLCVQLRNLRFMQSKLCTLEQIEIVSSYLIDKDNYYLTLPFLASLFQDSENQVIQMAFRLFISILLKLKQPFNSQQEVTLWRVFYWNKLMTVLQSNDPVVQRIGMEQLGNISRIVVVYEKFSQDLNNDSQLQFKPFPFYKDLIDFIMNKFQEASINKVEWAEMLINGLAQVANNLKGTQYDIPSNILTFLISMFNKSDLKLTILRNYVQIYEYFYQKKDDWKLLLSCVEQILNIRNDYQLCLALKFFCQAQEKGLLPEDLLLKYLKLISPLMVFPSIWVRVQAIEFVKFMISKYTPSETYFKIQPIIVPYLKEEISFLDQNIFCIMIGGMVDRQLIDQKEIKQEFQKSDNTITKAFLDNFLLKSKQSVSDRDDKDDKLLFKQKLEILERRHDLEMNLGKRLNDFILQAYKANIIYYGSGQKEDMFEKLIENYKVLKGQNQQTKITDDDIIRLSLKERGIDLISDSGVEKKLKRLLGSLQSLQSSLLYVLERYNIFSSMEFRNIQNALLIMNSLQIRSKQIRVREDINFSRQRQEYQPKYLGFKPQQQLVTCIYEHKDIVTCVDNFRDGRYFISGSYDGTVRLYDMNQIDQDFTAGSKSSVKCVEREDKLSHRVTAIKPIDQSDSFLVGTNTGFVELYKIDGGVKQQQQFKKAPSGEIKKIESLKNEFSESVFVYVTSFGDIVVEDTRSSRGGCNFSIGKERGLVTSMIRRGSQMGTCISTINGYCLVYDIRCNLVSNVLQLLSPENHPIPIFSMQNFKLTSQLNLIKPSQDLIAVGFQSHNNEVGFWNLDDLNENINPLLFLTCTDRKDVIIQNPRFRSLYKNEQFKNFSNQLDDRCQYDFVDNQNLMDLITYLKDPLKASQTKIKEDWLIGTKNCYVHMKSAFEAKSTVTSIISLPISGSQYPQNVENTIITASSDRCVQSWTLSSDLTKQGEKFQEKDQSGVIICQPQGFYDYQRKFTQARSGDVYVIHDYEVKKDNIPNIINKQPEKQLNQKREYRVDHKDCITDMTFIERAEQGVLITSSRDNTVKVWK